MTTAPPPPQAGFRGALAVRSFRLVWFAQLAGQLADKFLMFSLIILAYHVAGGSTPVAITLLAYTVPAVVIAPLAGVFADRHHRKPIMVWTNFARAILIALIPVASLFPALRGDYLHLLVITFAFSAVGQLFSPAEAAAIPTLLPGEALLAANSLVLATMVITLVVGGALAPVASRVDIYAPYWLASALFLVAGALVTFTRIPHQETFVDPERHPFRQVLAELREGLATVGSSPALVLTFWEVAVALLVMFMMFTLAPGYVTHVLGIAEQDSYVILVPATAGALLSALALGQWGRRLPKSAVLVAALSGAGLTLVALASVPLAMRHFETLREWVRLVAAGFALLLGLEFGALLIPALTYLMEETEDQVRGRTFALLFMVVNGASAVPVLVAAALADSLGIDRVIAGLGALLAVTAVGVGGFARRTFGR